SESANTSTPEQDTSSTASLETTPDSSSSTTQASSSATTPSESPVPTATQSSSSADPSDGSPPAEGTTDEITAEEPSNEDSSGTRAPSSENTAGAENTEEPSEENTGAADDTEAEPPEEDSGATVDTGEEPPENTASDSCTPSEATGTRASGSGPHDVVVETNSDPGINEGTIFRPAELGGNEKYPIFVWGQGACSRDGLANATAMAEIASHGYFVVADGTPNGSGNRTMDRADLAGMGAPLMGYVDWAVAENAKPCSVYYQSLETTKIASNGFSCGGLMAQGTVLDPRIVTWGVTSSGMAGATEEFYDPVHTPVLFVEGGPEEVAYDGGLQGY